MRDWPTSRSVSVPPVLVPVGFAVIVSLAYLHAHPYPAMGGGLYLQTVEAIREAGFGYPKTIPYYTPEGIPFGYPPLGFFLAAIVETLLPVSGVSFARFVPVFFWILTPISVYWFASAWLDSTAERVIATSFVAVSPEVFRLHISAGGYVRGLALVLLVLGLRVGTDIFRETTPTSVPWRRVAVAGGLFAATLLTHPFYALFFGLSYLILYLVIDRSRRGLIAGAVVATTGLVLSSPWWGRFFTTFRPELLRAAAQTHGGLGSAPLALVFRSTFVVAPQTNLLSIYYVLVLFGLLLYIAERRLAIPALVFGTVLVLYRARFVLLLGSIPAAHLLWTRLAPAIASDERLPRLSSEHVRVAFVGLILLYSAGAGALYAHNGPKQYSAAGHEPLPSFLTEADIKAADWLRTHTDPNATFVAVGSVAEWLPYLTKRTLLVSLWGAEWKGPGEFDRHFENQVALSRCETAACVSTVLSGLRESPDYVYVPNRTYSWVYSNQRERPEQLIRSLKASEAYEVAYRNEGAYVFAYDPSRSTSNASRSAVRSARRTPAPAVASRTASVR